ncbi:hypothetical protein C0991_011138, partial [Blastosporella zonata]
LEAMRLADAAWNAVDLTTIRHCWQKAGILPKVDQPSMHPTVLVSSLLNTDNTNPIASLEKEVERALNDLQASSVLQRQNRMIIKDLLNPIEETKCLYKTSDEDICKAVLDARQAQEDTLIMGGDNDVDDDADMPLTDGCLRRDFLKLSVSITSHLNSMNDPIARRVEADLASITRQMRRLELDTMTTSQISDYFPSK